MKLVDKIKIGLIFSMIIISAIYVWFEPKDPMLKAAEIKFREVNGFSVIIAKIDTITNETFAKIITKDKGIYFVPDSVLNNPNQVHHYYLSAKRRKGFSRRHRNTELIDEFSPLLGGLVVDKDFKRIEDPFKYRLDELLK